MTDDRLSTGFWAKGRGPAPAPTLAMTQLFDVAGTYPVRGGGPPANSMAMVHSFAGSYGAYGASTCAGQTFQEPQNIPLASLIGPTYGGGDQGLELPDLRGRTPSGADAAGGNPIGMVSRGGLAMTYMIAAEAGAGPPGTYPMIGAIGLFAAIWVPAGWLAADGSPFAISQNVALFETIGSAFGGNGATFFELPDLKGRAAMGAGAGPGLAPVAVGQLVDNSASDMVAALGINYVINTSGTAPPPSGNGGFPQETAMLGEVIAFAGPTAPAGWALCDGSLLAVQANQPLFELIGTTYGGDGQESFALPDLRGRMLTGPAR
jgi:microcystin-dependent protein